MFRMHIREGFEGQFHFVVPRHFLDQVANHPLLHALYPTDIGWYPEAKYHYRERPEGAPEYILIYCVAGRGWARIRDKTYSIKAGEALVIPNNVPHVYSASLDAPWSIHWIHFRGETAYQFVQQMPYEAHLIAVHDKAHTPIIETFRECHDALQHDFAMRQLIFVALAIHRILGWMFFGNPSFQPLALDIPQAVDKAIEYMHNNLDQRPTLSDLAHHAGLSVSHFSYLFKAHIGTPPIDYFINMKMQVACHLLETTNMPVKDVANSVGYDDQYYFSRLFRKVMGTSPANYRETCRTTEQRSFDSSMFRD